MRSERTTVSGWGRFKPAPVELWQADSRGDLASAPLPQRVALRGLGRSYGDAAQLRDGDVIATDRCQGVQWLDADNGVVRADAGVTIGELIDRFTPKGWFVPVTPGTRQVTVGGAIAADIHGKNHHVDGSFGSHVRSLRLRLASDEIVTIGPDERPELFWATVGGMGLTGIVIDADITLTAIPSSIVRVETHRLDDLDALLDEMRVSDTEHDFSVAWVDLLGGARSVLTQGSFATPDQLGDLGRSTAAGRYPQPPTPAVGLPPVPLPRLAIRPSLRVFNELWWRRAPAELTVSGESITAFFHPLDAVRDWNRVYGPTGFVQWQCVVDDEETLRDLVERLGRLPSFFTVLKRFGPGNGAPLSFPQPGWTLAVDLPATTETLSGLGDLDRLVTDAGGRIYLAKDARLDRADFEAMYRDLDAFKAIRSAVDPDKRFSSDLAIRLGL